MESVKLLPVSVTKTIEIFFVVVSAMSYTPLCSFEKFRVVDTNARDWVFKQFARG